MTTTNSSRPTREEAWADRAASLAEFRTTHGRLPVSTEDPLYSWMMNQRRSVAPSRAAVLDGTMPDWRTPTVRQIPGHWESVLTLVEAFVADNGRLPSAVTSEADANERRLRNWINTQRCGTTPEREAILDARVPSWRPFGVLRRWEDSLDAVTAFVNNTGDFPRQTSTDAETRRLAHWLKEQRMEDRPERAAILDERIPGWRGNHPGHRSWEDSFAGVAAFFATEGRLPLALKTAGPEEKRLRVWLADQKNRASADQRVLLDALCPDWAEPLYSWDERFESVKAFHAANGRLPRSSDTGDAHVLGRWVSSQRQTGSDRARAIFEAEFPGWCLTLEEQWSNALDSLVAVIADTGRLPSARGTGDSVSIARWLQKQRKNTPAERAERLDAAVPGWRGVPRKKLAA